MTGETPFLRACAVQRSSVGAMFRQVHPRFVVGDKIQRDVVVPNSGDDHQLSTADGDRVTGAEATSLYRARLGADGEPLQSVGCVEIRPDAVSTVREAVNGLTQGNVSLRLVDDGQCPDRPDEHGFVDYRGNSKQERKLLYQGMHERVLAVVEESGWAHGPDEA